MARATPSLVRRLAARLARSLSVWSGLQGGGGVFSAARQDRLTLDWIRRPLSADKELQGNLAKLRARSRELQKNNPYAAQAIRLYAVNVAGPKGITLQCKVVNNRDRLEDETNRRVEDAWADWGRPDNCTVNGRYSWIDLQQLAIELTAGEGESLIRLVHGAPNPYGFALQLLDADLLDEDLNVPREKAQNEIRMGVELDMFERPVAYHLFRRHPEELVRSGVDRMAVERERVPAAEIVHLFRPSRVGQSRGYPWLAPVMYNLRMLGAYQEAEVVASRAAAAKMGVITTDPEAYGMVPGEAPYNDVPTTIDVEPGTFYSPRPGQSVTLFDPQHPTQQYRDFVKGMLQSVAAGAGLAYASLSADLEGTSYASGRTGLLQERDRYRALQGWLLEHLCRRVFTEWLKAAALHQKLPGEKTDRIAAAVVWQPRGWAWVDPQSDVEASIKAIEYGLDSRTRLLAEQGRDIEDTLEDLRREDELAEQKDVEVSGKSAAPVPAPVAEEPEPADEADAGEEGAAAADRAVLLEALARIQPTVVSPNIEVHVPRTVETKAPGRREVTFKRDATGQIVGAEIVVAPEPQTTAQE